MKATPNQLKEAFDYCLDFAQTMLLNSGEFYPFGALTRPNGELAAVGGWTGEERPASKELFQFLGKSLRLEIAEGSAIALAVAADVNVPAEYEAPYRDAIRILLETSGYSRFIYVPYELRRQGIVTKKMSIELAESFSVELQPTF